MEMSCFLVINIVIFHGPMNSSPRPDAYRFDTTQWSMVLSAGGPTCDSSVTALSQLCERYYFPVYAYIRNSGNRREDAEDLTQAFFERILEKAILSRADPSRGRFRSFLLTAAKNFLHNQHDKRAAQKRGGGVILLSLDYDEADEQFIQLASDDLDPEKLFDREWSRTLIARVIAQVRDESVKAGREEFFEAIQSHLWSDSDAVPYPELAEQLGMSLSAVKVNAFRMRARFREIFEAEIENTVSEKGEVEDEWFALLQAFES